MSASAAAAGNIRRKRPNYRLRSWATEALCVLLGLVLIAWSVLPIYNMLMVALQPHGDVFTSTTYPVNPTFNAFWVVLTESFWYVEEFWHQYWNSVYMGGMTVFLTLLIGSLTSFAVGRMRIRHGWMITNAALLTYVIPASFLSIPFYVIMNDYGMVNNIWAVIASLVTFATPYAIFIFLNYGASIPMELDEAARIDGASPLQVYWRIYIPLMAPAMVAVGTYALLLSWNEFLYQYLLLSSNSSMTVAVALAQFLNSDESPWNLMMATAVIYALVPVAVYYMFRSKMTSGLTMGGVKG